jgi:lipoyl(octanoyl) transferase
VRRGCTYHGIAINVDLDLTPFARINPCGYPGLAITRLEDLGVGAGTQTLGDGLARQLGRLLKRPLTIVA